jgi:hypothetical protein
LFSGWGYSILAALGDSVGFFCVITTERALAYCHEFEKKQIHDTGSIAIARTKPNLFLTQWAQRLDFFFVILCGLCFS